MGLLFLPLLILLFLLPIFSCLFIISLSGGESFSNNDFCTEVGFERSLWGSGTTLHAMFIPG